MGPQRLQCGKQFRQQRSRREDLAAYESDSTLGRLGAGKQRQYGCNFQTINRRQRSPPAQRQTQRSVVPKHSSALTEAWPKPFLAGSITAESLACRSFNTHSSSCGSNWMWNRTSSKSDSSSSSCSCVWPRERATRSRRWCACQISKRKMGRTISSLPRTRQVVCAPFLVRASDPRPEDMPPGPEQWKAVALESMACQGKQAGSSLSILSA